MVCHQAYDNLRYHFLLGPLPSQFCYGLSTSSHRNGHLHGTSTRHPDRTWELQGSRIEVREEYLRSKTIWSRMKLIPHGQTHVPGIDASLINDCAFFRDDIIFMVYVDNGIFLGNDDSKLQAAIQEIQELGLNI